MALRWGFASAGKITHDFVCALQTLPSENHQLVAVGARTLDGAKEFAQAHGIPKFVEGYETLAKLNDVDIVYIGVINTMHLQVAKLMLDNGKHVLCEKPLTMNKKQSSELLEYAKQKKLFFMEAVWSRCFPVYKELKKQIDSGIIGDVVHTNVTFGFPLEHVDRVSVKELGGGTILDIGIYALQFTQYVHRGEQQVNFLGTGSLNKYGVDDSASAILRFSNKKTGVVSISALAEFPNEAVVIGTKGIIKIPQFWCPTKLITPKETLEFALPKSDKTYNFLNSVGLNYEAEECRRCINEGLLQSPCMPHAESLELAELMDKWRATVGVVYKEDS